MPSIDDNAPLYEEGEPLIYDSDFQHFHKERLKKKRRLRFVIALLISLTVLFLLVVALFLITNLYNKTDDGNGSKSKLGDYKKAAVASDVEQCSEIGKDILKKKGTAVDASIAALLCMGVADPQSMGIGGGFFMTVYDKAKKKVVIIDARETAAGKATQDMYVKHPETSVRGPLSIAVPGELKGYWKAHKEFGVLPWKELFEPTIKMCLEGFKIPGSLGRAILKSKKDILEEPSLREVFLNPDTGELYKTAEIMKRVKLGKTLKTIAEENMESFYTGSLSKLLLEDLKKINSIITAEDLKTYKAIQREPLKIKLNNGLSLYSPPPPASGAVLSFILNILDVDEIEATTKVVILMVLTMVIGPIHTMLAIEENVLHEVPFETKVLPVTPIPKELYKPKSMGSREDINWWLNNVNTKNGKLIRQRNIDIVIQTDSSLSGWGCLDMPTF